MLDKTETKKSKASNRSPLRDADDAGQQALCSPRKGKLASRRGLSHNVTQFPETKAPDFMMGAMKKYPVIIEGRKIPGLQAWKEGERTFILVDDRIAVSVLNECAYDVCFIVASALAIGAGYANIHSENRDRCFAPICSEIKL